MIFLRSVLFNIAMYGSGLVFSIWAHLGKNTRPENSLRSGQSWSRFTLAMLSRICHIDIEVEGAENLPRSGGALIAAQHQSALDILVWLALLPRPAYVLKRELLGIPIFGSALTLAKMIAVDRAGGAGSLRKMVEECRAAIGNGRQIIIFPEGTRVAAGEPAKLQPGIVALAKALDVDVIPAATNSGLRWRRKAFIKTPGPVGVKVHPPISRTLKRDEILAQIAGHFYCVDDVD